MKLAEDWLNKANAIEAEGFHRFATELKKLVEDYRLEAERIKDYDGFADSEF